jgi:putative hydrolase of the HAD superfamily
MPVAVFDLDDTLYKEESFVSSGFHAVAEDLYTSYAVSKQGAYECMWNELKQSGRGKVFDRVLTEYGLLTKGRVKQCLSVYRAHRPDIMLYPDAVRCFQKLSGIPIYIVTDGNKLVQQRKLEALGLYHHPQIRRCFISRRYGIHNEKPSVHCFEIICKLEKVLPSQVYYVGDNPNKDFVGIKPLGYRTVRVMRGNFKEMQLDAAHEADIRILSLDELPRVLGE